MSDDVEFRLKRLEAENTRLKRAVEELSVLNEVASAVASTLTLDEVVNLIVQKCVKHLRVEQGAVLLFDSQKPEEGAALKTMVRKVESDYKGIPYRLGDQITGWMLKNQQPLMINDLQNDTHFRVPPEATSVRSLMCVPLRLKGRMIGVLSVFNKRGGEDLSENDQRLLTIIAAQSAQVIENARLYEEEQALAKIERELETARTIQTKLLPERPPDVDGFDIAATSEPARSVGGDYYDFLNAGEGTLAICLADVSGKGISAALLVTGIHATLRSQIQMQGSVAERVSRADKLLYDSTEADKYATMFYGELDLASGKLRYTNAGHNPPIVISTDGSEQLLEAGGPPVGLLPISEYSESSIELKPDDLLLIYTDGFSEAMDLRLNEYGEDRLHSLASENRTEEAAAVMGTIINQVQEFVGEAPQTDDMTMIVMKRTAAASAASS